MANEKKPFKYFGKKFYFIEKDGKMIKRFGMFRTKDFVRQTIRKYFSKYGQEDYSVGIKFVGKKG